MKATRTIKALAIVALGAALGACGGGDEERGGSGGPAALTVVCPGMVPSDVLLGGAFDLGTRKYLVRADSTNYATLGAGAVQIPTTLTLPRFRTADSHAGNHVLHIVGCRDSSLLLVTFRDADNDGIVDDKIGEMSLNPSLHFTAMLADLEHSCVYAYDSKGRALLKYTDTNGDGLPDTETTMVTHGSSTPLIDDVGHIGREPGGVLILAPTARDAAGMTLVSVVTDSDFDGTPESVTIAPHATHANEPPRLRYPPRVGDGGATVLGVPGSTVEIWLVNEDGTKVSADPNVARLGSGTLSSSEDSISINFGTPLASDTRISAFQTSPTSGQGPVHLAEAAYPLIKAVSHTSVNASSATVVTVAGDNFASGVTQVSLTQNAPSQTITLTPVVSSATQLTVTIPTLDPTWQGTSFLRVFDANSPQRESRAPLLIYR